MAEVGRDLAADDSHRTDAVIVRHLDPDFKLEFPVAIDCFQPPGRVEIACEMCFYKDTARTACPLRMRAVT